MGGMTEYEKSDSGSKAILIGIAIIAVGTVAIVGGAWLVLRPLQDNPAYVPLSTTHGDKFALDTMRNQVGPEPLKRLRAWEDEQLSTYGWVDRNDGIVRIPIERAMEIVVNEGLPATTSRPAERPDKAAGEYRSQSPAQRRGESDRPRFDRTDNNETGHVNDTSQR